MELETKRRRLLAVYCTLFALLAAWAAIEPFDRKDWALENLLVVIAFVLLVSTYKLLPLSRVSYTLIFVFLCLHELGSHYTYAEVPYDAWTRAWFGTGFNEWIGWERNNYDRIVHCAYGLLLAYPVREVFLRFGDIKGFWVGIVAAVAIHDDHDPASLARRLRALEASAPITASGLDDTRAPRCGDGDGAILGTAIGDDDLVNRVVGDPIDDPRYGLLLVPDRNDDRHAGSGFHGRASIVLRQIGRAIHCQGVGFRCRHQRLQRKPQPSQAFGGQSLSSFSRKS